MVSSTGDPLTLAASLVIVFSATGSAPAVAAVYAVRTAAALLVGSTMGWLTDRVDRRRLVLALDVARALLIATMPFATRLSVFVVYVYLLALGGVEALVQPARLAAVPGLVGKPAIEVANSLLVSAVSLAQVAGFALAGVTLAVVSDPRPLYLCDALSFAVAAALVWSLPTLGGGDGGTAVGALRARLPPVPLRPLLALAAAANLLIGVATPALLPLAFLLSARGPVAYAALEMALIGGIVSGGLASSRVPSSATLRAMGPSLLLFSAATLAVGVAPLLVTALLAISISGAGNAIFAVGNRSALMRAAGQQEQGTVMAARFALCQTAQVLGLGCGAALVAALGPRFDFGMVAFGLALIGGFCGLRTLGFPPPYGPRTGEGDI